MEKRWIFKTPDTEARDRLARTLGVRSLTALLLLNRGVSDPSSARRFLNPAAADLHDPSSLPDLDVAVESLRRAIRDRERIAVYGDYDVDGMTACAIYLQGLRKLGGTAEAYLPHRMREGYGLNRTAIEHLAACGTRVLLTADCGSTSHSEVARARELGMEVIVTDHHELPDPAPKATALINPKRTDSRYPFTGLCTAGIAFKLIGAVSGRSIEEYLDLVALGTVADVMPLLDENRYLVSEGLRCLSRTNRPGLVALKAAAGLNGTIGVGTVGFGLAPRLNAAGRLDDARIGLDLLLTDSAAVATEQARRLDEQNRERQRVEAAMVEEARSRIESDGLMEAPCFVLDSSNWHLGVVGIVAARLAERYHRPAVVLARLPGGAAKGSARTIPGFHLVKALSDLSGHLDGYGGHAAAAGLTIRSGHIESFREALKRKVIETVGSEGLRPQLRVDAVVELDELNLPLVHELSRLGPHGPGNPEPVLSAANLTAFEPRVVGQDHLRFRVRQNRNGGLRTTWDAIGFKMASLKPLLDRPVDLAFCVEINRWQGEERIQLRVKDLRPYREMGYNE
jgi:single-stranded-DNA-specific exonuclease